MWEDATARAERRYKAAVAQLGQCQGTVVDLGGHSPFQGHLKQNHLGSHTTYVCLDLDPSGRPNVIGDAIRVPLADCSVSALLCDAMLEHVTEPHQVVEEIYRILKPGAPLLVSVPFVYPYHDQVDYYRFSDDALRYLFRKFDGVELEPKGDYTSAAIAFMTGFSLGAGKWLAPFAALLRRVLSAIVRRRGSSRKRNLLRSLQHTAIGWYLYARKPID